MNNFFVISSAKPYAEALKRFIELKYNRKVFILEIPEILKQDNFDLQQMFKLIFSSLKRYEPAELRNSIAIIDLPFYESEIQNYQLLGYPADIHRLASMLIFAFPEIYWVLPVYYGNPSEDQSHLVKWKELTNMFSKVQGHSPLFDTTNLRNEILEKIEENPENRADYFVIREKDSVSASIDEEQAYSYLHGYLAYKLGYRNYVITTLNEMKSLDQSSDKNSVKLIFEDIYLNFPDEHPKDFSNLQGEERDKKYSFLPSSEKRIFVTVGHKGKFDRENEEYIQSLRIMGKILGKKIKKVFKPSGGIYKLLEESGLLKEYWKKRKEEWKNSKAEKIESGGHSAPGKLFLIAESLINRAEKILQEATTVKDCVHGATLAFEAQRLVGYKTPTTCLEAIALRHQLEVKAECMFYGISYNIDVKNRIKEIEKEIEVVGRWFNSRIRKKAILNAKMILITEIMNILRERGQFNEEQECLDYFRKLDRRWSLHQPGFNKFIAGAVYPIRWYIEFLLGSFSRFILAIIFWPIIFALIAYIANIKIPSGEVSLTNNLMYCFSVFFDILHLDFDAGEMGIKIIGLFLGALGFLHLGIFISYLYTLVMKGRG